MLKNKFQNKWQAWVAMGVAILAISTGTSAVAYGQKGENSAKPLEVISPKYPRKAAEQGIEGWVRFQFNLNEKGKPVDIKIVEANPKGVFDQYAKKAISQWKFARNEGQTQDLFYTMEFSMGGASAKSK